MLCPTIDSCEEVESDFTRKNDAMKHLRSLVENLDINPSENYLKRYLCGANYDVELAFKKLKSCHDHLLDHRDWYRVEEPIKLKHLIDTNIRCVLPDCDKEGRPIYIFKNGNIDVSKMSLLDVVSVDDVWIESILSENPEAASKGLCVIMDIKDQSWKLNKWMQPSNIMNSIKKVDALPFKDFKCHVVNNSWWISIALKIVWPFLPQKFKDMIKFHFDDIGTLFEYIDQKVLPVEYGGLKEIKYAELYDKLYKRNDEIFQSLECYRNVKK